ncbi:hypothetical protein JW872_00615 [Candidatus Babeliales bacterium]|nr:hypothetical protein [Candidatus Babeliales bacterium]
MTINFTLFIQMFHFWMGYLIVRFLIVKPIIPLILKEEEEVAVLKHDIDAHSKDVELKEQRKKYDWDVFELSFKELYPTVEVEPRSFRSVPLPDEHVTEDKKIKTREVLVAALTERLRHVE